MVTQLSLRGLVKSNSQIKLCDNCGVSALLNLVSTLLDRHWIAVFGMVVERNLKTKVKDLKNLFWSTEGIQQACK